MQRWYRLNVYFSIAGLLVFVASLFMVQSIPLFVLPGAFGIGIFVKCFMNIYKGVEPPTTRSTKNPYDTRNNNKKKKSK